MEDCPKNKNTHSEEKRSEKPDLNNEKDLHKSPEATCIEKPMKLEESCSSSEMFDRKLSSESISSTPHAFAKRKCHSKYYLLAIGATIIIISIITLGVVVMLSGLFYTVLSLKAEVAAAKNSNEETIRNLNASIQDRIDQAVYEHSQVEANVTLQRNLSLLSEDLITGLLSFANLAEDIRKNFTTIFTRIEGVDTYLQQYEDKLTHLEEATETVENQLMRLAAEFNRNATAITTFLENITTGLSQLELNTIRDLTRVNTSLNSKFQILSERLMTAREETQSLVNGIQGHVDAKVTEVRGHIDTEVSEMRSYVDTEVSEVRNNVDTQFSDVRESISTAVSEVRGFINTQITGVTESIDTKITNVRQYINSEIDHVNSHVDTEVWKLRNGAIALEGRGLLVMITPLLSLPLIFHY